MNDKEPGNIYIQTNPSFHEDRVRNYKSSLTILALFYMVWNITTHTQTSVSMTVPKTEKYSVGYELITDFYKIIRSGFTYAILPSLIILLSACDHNKYKKFISAEQIVEELDRSYIHFEGIGYVESARIYSQYAEDRIADFHIHLSEKPKDITYGFDLSTINSNKSAAKELFMAELRGLKDYHRELFDSLASFNRSARFNINADNDTITAIVILSPQDIKEALSRPSYNDNSELGLDVFCRIMNIILPVYVDEYTKWMAVTLDQNYVVFRYEINDSENPVYNWDLAHLKQELTIQYGQTFDSIEKIIWNAVETDRGMKYVYEGTSSGKTAVITINEKELKDIFFKYYKSKR